MSVKHKLNFFILFLLQIIITSVTSVPSFLGLSSWSHPSMVIPWYADIRVSRKCLNKSCKDRTDYFRQEWEGVGRIDIDFFNMHTYGAISVYLDMTYNPNTPSASKKSIHFIGWNFLLTQNVDRYLIVDEFCQTYNELYGYPGDPIKTVLDKFNLLSEGDNSSKWTFNEKNLRRDDVQAVVVTEKSGSPVSKITINYDSKGSKAVSETVYSNGKSRSMWEDTPVDSKYFLYKYQNFSCGRVRDFFGKPEVCLDGILALEYQC